MAQNLRPAVEFNVGSPIGQFRFVPVSTGRQKAFLVVHSSCAEVDPYHRMFFLPTDTLKLSAFSETGQQLWRRDLGGGMIPGVWFCPVLPFDLDGDGVDEIWLVNNADPDHPLNHEQLILERSSAATGEVIATRPWPQVDRSLEIGFAFRNFINAGLTHGRRRLITAQGTYGTMQLQCLDDKLQQIWSRRIDPDDPGARGSHMFPVLDIDGDGRDELFWGERCIDIDTGADIWVGDAEGWTGHSDVIQPTLNRSTGRWSVYTLREAFEPDHGAVVMFDDAGRELWAHRNMGHMDMGWTARLGPGGEHLCLAVEIGDKTAGPEGFERSGETQFLYDVTGNPLRATFGLCYSVPVDFNGDGVHELTYTSGKRTGQVVDRTGTALYQLQGRPAVAGKILDAPGEQIVTYDADGTVRIYCCPDATDTPEAAERYSHPYYVASLRLWAMGYNRTNLGGL